MTALAVGQQVKVTMETSDGKVHDINGYLVSLSFSTPPMYDICSDSTTPNLINIPTEYSLEIRGVVTSYLHDTWTEKRKVDRVAREWHCDYCGQVNLRKDTCCQYCGGRRSFLYD